MKDIYLFAYGRSREQMPVPPRVTPIVQQPKNDLVTYLNRVNPIMLSGRRRNLSRANDVR